MCILEWHPSTRRIQARGLGLGYRHISTRLTSRKACHTMLDLNLLQHSLCDSVNQEKLCEHLSRDRSHHRKLRILWMISERVALLASPH